MSRLDAIKKAAIKAQNKQTVAQAAAALKARKAEIKREEKEMKRLNKSIKKAERLAVGSFDFNREENMHYSDREISAYLEGSTIMETYLATKDDWD